MKGESISAWVKTLSEQFPRQKTWVRAKGYWQARGQENIANLIALIFQASGAHVEPGVMKPRESIRLYYRGDMVDSQSLSLQAGKPWVAIIDQDRGDSKGNIDLIDQLCANTVGEGFDCLALFALWGESSTHTLKMLKKWQSNAPINGDRLSPGLCDWWG